MTIDRIQRQVAAWRVATALVALAALPTIALSAPAASEPTSAEQRIDPKATGLLQQSLAYLAAQQVYTVKITNTDEAMLVNGQKLNFEAVTEVAVRRPNQLRARRAGALEQGDFYYDGKTVTVHMNDARYYAVQAVPDNLDDALDAVRDLLQIDLPGADLIYTDAYQGMTWEITDAMIVGKETIGGAATHHLAFRTPSIDFQVWIEDGARPLPRKYLINTKWMTGQPQHGISLSDWNLSPRLDGSAFTFVPPAGAKKIEFLTSATSGAR